MLGPIFVREWLTVPRRPRHYLMRSAFLGLLWIFAMTAWQATVGWGRNATLGDTAHFGSLLFKVLVLYVQLPLLLFFAALSAASAVALEKDRRTFILLLLTDMRDYEIVLGKLLGSLLPIVLLLLGSAPVLGLMLLLGGIAPWQVGQALLVLGMTALTAGSVGGLVALWRERTFQALALTVLCLVLYLCLAQAVALLPLPDLAWAMSGEQGTEDGWRSLQAWIDPFQALQSVLEPPGATFLAIPPAYGFAGVMGLFSILLNGWGILRLRVWNPSGEPIMQREAPTDAEAEEKDRARAHAAPGAVRHVWANPILWREIMTRAYGRRPLLVKVAYFLVLALICWYALSALGSQGLRPGFVAAAGLVPVTILSLLLVGAQAVTAITSEKDGRAIDLLLVTDLSPREFIFGKLWGICWNAKEYLVPPFVLAGIYAYFGVLATPPRAHPQWLVWKNVEAAAAVTGALLVLLSFATVLAVHVALRTENSRLAVINTLGTIFFLSVGTLVCIYLILINGRFEYQWASFILFIAAGIGGLWWVLSADRPSPALTLASWICPLGVFYTVTNILVAKPGSEESTDPLYPFLVIAGVFGFTIMAMVVPLLSEFDVATGRTTGEGA